MQFADESAHWIAVALSSDGLITSLSSTAELLTGYSAHELVGRPVTKIIADQSVFDVAQMMKSASDWGVWEGEIVHRVRSGESLKAHASLAQLSSRSNHTAGFLLLSAPDRQAAGGACGAALGEVAARLRETAHELNNPLAVMMGFTQLILLDRCCEGKIRADVERLYAEMQRIIQVVEKLHTYALSLEKEPPQAEHTSRTN